MDVWFQLETVSDLMKATIGGLAVGFLFGFAAQRSQFCLRSATIEFWTGSSSGHGLSGRLGGKVAIWLLTFATALAGTQILLFDETLTTESVRQLSSAGTLSGAMVGGLMFGAGMILARGCASRVLVLSATGNMRALITGLMLTVVAQASLTGILSPAREGLSSLWVLDGDSRGLLPLLPEYGGIFLGVILLGLAVYLARRTALDMAVSIGAIGVGLAVMAGWYYTATLAASAFDPVSVESVSFTGPSANTLMALITSPSLDLGFGTGLVPGVFIGSFVSAVTFGTFRFQAFSQETGLLRYMIGAALMGFGGMLAGGCAVGAGVTGGALLSITSWVALTAMWISAGLTHRLVDGQPSPSGNLAIVPPASS